ncbi:hypothetical protein HO133_002584 [Letharia lupina]|uniref:Uncharacterized protein n=1 Tax=Letharia lupina TaxID=560253 RepID=A0A8H6CCG2_9LECA|nr:uncharacterized protein HO133_002584 [Letharia lupina]KAF6220904.1 hypothetical protein HO133_002584 [Letharia lupina]
MFSFLESKTSASKAYVSHGNLPPFVDPEQPPSTKKPFSTILGQPFTHTVQLILPQELYDVVWKEVEAKISNIQYSRVIMPLSGLLEGDFFNRYIKIGNILMLSEGRPGVDDRYSLKDGKLVPERVLRLELAKDKYERCGLVGQPVRDAGRKHLKTRYAVDINLRLPSMLHGKKGFERIVWALKNVLNHSVTWLFHDLNSNSEPSKAIASAKPDDNCVTECSIAATDAPIIEHHPVTKDCSPHQKTTERVSAPNFIPPPHSDSNDDFEDWALETYEWLSLVAMESPRILSEDTIDPYLSRYQIPDGDSAKVLNMITLTWTGFIPALWARHLFICLSSAKTTIREGASSEDFFALSAYSFKTAVTDQKDAYTILCVSDEIVNSQSAVAVAGKTKESGHSRVYERRGRKYVLWEQSCG